MRPGYRKSNGSKTVLRMPSTYRCAVSVPLMTTKGVWIQKKGHSRPLLLVGTLPWPSPDTSSMIVRTQMEAGFVAKYYTSPVSMIPT
ncbi:hypothetical protein TNCV_4606981 [Trichonephila clavipes]|nr:hypothetical protein TNCV_4606981 [Trichonephila clavipes]